LQPDVLRKLMVHCDYQLKFVIACEDDMHEVNTLVNELAAPAEKVILMPEGIQADDLNTRGVWIAELCKEFGYRFSPRLHVLLWGNKRGI
jgi:7-carboxy-7-deazaguanine synthase